MYGMSESSSFQLQYYLLVRTQVFVAIGIGLQRFHRDLITFVSVDFNTLELTLPCETILLRLTRTPRYLRKHHCR